MKFIVRVRRFIVQLIEYPTIIISSLSALLAGQIFLSSWIVKPGFNQSVYCEQIAQASILGDAGIFVLNSLLKAAGGIWIVLGILITFTAKKYLVPFLLVERNRRYAEWIARIADEVTDDLVRRYPDEQWLKFLDQAVDRVMEICGISEETARRAVNSAVSRK